MVETQKKKTAAKAKKKTNALWKRVNDWFHLWIGIVTGIPVVLISLTGCLLVFEQEITQLSRPWWKVENMGEEHILPPSLLRRRVLQQLPNMQMRKFWYYGAEEPVKIAPDNSDSLLYVNPYTGKLLAQVDHENFFHFIDEGHRNLWIPGKLGHQVVTWCTLIFGLLLLTGLVLWWPKKWNKRLTRQALTINWRAKWKRINYDLHNVLGFYALLLGLLMAFTGLMMGFMLVRNGVFHLLGGQDRVKAEAVVLRHWQDVLPDELDQKMDAIYWLVTQQIGERNAGEISIHYPQDKDKTIYACTDMQGGSWRSLFFDRHSLDLMSSSDKKIAEDNTADWMMRSNYGLHTGFIGGLTTKWLYFFASLICASLPITGFYVWWGKRSKAKRGK